MSRSQTALVIGGSGFIGRNLVALLREKGVRVRIASRSSGGRSSSDGVEYVRGDVADRKAFSTAVRGVDVVYHLATGGGQNWEDFERDYIRGTENVADACLDAGARLVYASSSAALYLGGSQPVTEADGTDPKPEVRAHYSRAKCAAEAVLRRRHAERQLAVVIVRPAVVAGRGGIVTHSGAGYWANDAWCLGWGRGQTPLPFVLVEDVAAAMALAGTTPGIEGRAYNLAGDVTLSAQEYVNLIAERAGRRIHFYPQSLWKMQAIEVGKWLMKVASRRPNVSFPSYRDLVSRSMRAPIDCSAAKRELGWKPNADRQRFVAEAIEANVAAPSPGDLRLSAVAGAPD